MAKDDRIRRLGLPFAMGAATVVAAEVARRAYRESQLFEPSADPTRSWTPEDYGIPAGATEEEWFETPDGELLHGWYCRAKNPVASALYCHGNTGNLTVSAADIPHMLEAGLNVLYFDYRGFGKSSGKASVKGVIADGVTAARFHETLRPQHLPSVLYGFSLGGAVAAQVIKRHPFDGLILQSTFTSLPQLTRVLYPRLPMHLLAGGLFDTEAVIKRLRVPLLIIHGTTDETIPAWMAHALFDACTTPKQIQIVESGLHKDLYQREGDALSTALRRFAMTLSRNTKVALEPLPPNPAAGLARRFFRRFVRRRPPSSAESL
jgi:uncharacterized protein